MRDSFKVEVKAANALAAFHAARRRAEDGDAACTPLVERFSFKQVSCPETMDPSQFITAALTGPIHWRKEEAPEQGLKSQGLQPAWLPELIRVQEMVDDDNGPVACLEQAPGNYVFFGCTGPKQSVVGRKRR